VHGSPAKDDSPCRLRKISVTTSVAGVETATIAETIREGAR
jgi:hypothetical protein